MACLFKNATASGMPCLFENLKLLCLFKDLKPLLMALAPGAPPCRPRCCLPQWQEWHSA